MLALRFTDKNFDTELKKLLNRNVDGDDSVVGYTAKLDGLEVERASNRVIVYRILCPYTVQKAE